MANKLKLRDLDMDTMEILYYERQAKRKRAYAAKRRKKSTIKKELSTQKPCMEEDSDSFSNALRKAM